MATDEELLQSGTHHASLMWNGHEIPSWAYESKGQACVEQWRLDCEIENNPDHAHETLTFVMGCLTYPAWKYVFLSTVCLWTFWASAGPAVYINATCDGRGVADVEGGHLLAIAMVYSIVLSISLILEWKAHKWILPGLARLLHDDLQKPYMIGGVRLSFQIYVFVGLGLSTLSHADLFTTAVFCARLLKTHFCHESKVEALWAVWIESGNMSLLKVPLAWLCVLLWCAMVGQLFIALRYGVPNKRHDFLRLACANGLPRANVWNRQDMGWSQIDNDRVYTTVPLQSLAEASRMYLVCLRGANVYEICIQDQLQYCTQDRDQWKDTMRRIAQRLFAFTCLESTLFANLQVTVIAIDRALSKEIDALTVLSVWLSTIMALYTIVTKAIAFFRMLQRIWEFCDPAKPDPDSHIESRGPLARRRHILQITSFFTFAALVSLWLLAYSWMHLYAVVFVCADGIWNFSMPMEDGCVPAREIHSMLDV